MDERESGKVARSDEPSSPLSHAELSAATSGDGSLDDGPGATRLIVGMGASAGGLDAFKSFFLLMPPDSGISFVLVQHLDPDRKSSLVSIIATYTTMPVCQAATGTRVEPDHVYILPPNAILTIKGGVLQVETPALPGARHTAINTFLASLAEDQEEDAVGIILSGYGSDGALGMAAIKEHGGLTLSQADFDHHAKEGMPQSAASGGLVDHVLAVEAMPAALLDYQNHRMVFDSVKDEDGIRADIPDHLNTIYAVLHGRLGRDFSQYKSGTVMRRIQRRMHVLQTDDIGGYIEQLRSSPHEAELLFRELLIGVTRFFRDRRAFEALDKDVLRPLFSDPTRSDPIRVWVAGCATGEEAYSIAILLKEGLRWSRRPRSIQVFATDVDARAIDIARAGVYAGTLAAEVSEERLAQNFVQEDGCYRVTKDLREMCLFSVHDLVKDPPLSRLDLIACRNLMIYFELPLQQRVLTTFHYGLRPDGHLFLGPSEGVSAQSRLFDPIDKRHRIYARRDTAATFPTVAFPRPSDGTATERRLPPPAADDIERRAARVMAPYAPAYLIVDRNYDVRRFSGQTAKFLEPHGVASLNLFNLLHPDLRATVRVALRHVATTGEVAVQDNVSFKTQDHYEAVRLIIEPLSSPDQAMLFVVAFQQFGRGAAAGRETSIVAADGENDVAMLQREMAGTRERLRNVSEELEAANEELQSSNEEYLSVNEELQSTNEELETSKEELQSLNEELQTINAELSNRNDSLMRLNSDLSNLFDSTSIATLFLDKDFNIRRFTPGLLDIFNVREGDEGRPISDIVTRLTRDGLAENAKQVLRTLVPVEREVSVFGGASYLMQVRPYRGLNNVIDGVVVTFVDISERKDGERARSQLAAIVESSQDAILSYDIDGVIESWNKGAEQLYGYPPSEAIGSAISELLGGSLPEDWPLWIDRLRRGETIEPFDSVRVSEAGRSIDMAVSISPVMDVEGRVVGASVVARDISERKAAGAEAMPTPGEADDRVRGTLQIVSAVVGQTLQANSEPVTSATRLWRLIQAIGDTRLLLTHAEEGAVTLRAILEAGLAPHHGVARHEVAISGPDIRLTPKASLWLAVAIDELACNAAHYGALATADGRLAIGWTIDRDGSDLTLALTWSEAGAPEVKAPMRRGVGTMLFEHTLAHELGARVGMAFPPDGLRCTLLIPFTPAIGSLRPAGDVGGMK